MNIDPNKSSTIVALSYPRRNTSSSKKPFGKNKTVKKFAKINTYSRMEMFLKKLERLFFIKSSEYKEIVEYWIKYFKKYVISLLTNKVDKKEIPINKKIATCSLEILFL